MQKSIIADLNWLKSTVLKAAALFSEEKHRFSGVRLDAPEDLTEYKDEYASFVIKNELMQAERLLLVTCISRYVSDIWKPLYIEGNPFAIHTDNDVAYPAPNTFLALLCGQDFEKRIEALNLFKSEHLFFKKSEFLTLNKRTLIRIRWHPG